MNPDAVAREETEDKSLLLNTPFAIAGAEPPTGKKVERADLPAYLDVGVVSHSLGSFGAKGIKDDPLQQTALLHQSGDLFLQRGTDGADAEGHLFCSFKYRVAVYLAFVKDSIHRLRAN